MGRNTTATVIRTISNTLFVHCTPQVHPMWAVGVCVRLTQGAGVVHKDHLLDEGGRGPQQHSVHCPQECGEVLIVEADDHTGGRQFLGRGVLEGRTAVGMGRRGCSSTECSWRWTHSTIVVSHNRHTTVRHSVTLLSTLPVSPFIHSTKIS